MHCVHIILMTSIGLCTANYTKISVTSHSFSPGISYCSTNFNPNSVSCYYDLKSVEVCRNGTYTKINCLEDYFCDKNTLKCTGSIDPYNKNNCPHGGVFPLLSDCRKYIYCYRDMIWKCEKGKVFDYKTNECKRGVRCKTFNEKVCKSNKNRFLPHPNPKWYVYCFGNVPILGECPGIYVWDHGLQKCRYDCEEDAFVTKSGKYPDYISEYIFHECSINNGTWTTNTFKCDEGKKFFQSFGTCL